MATRDEAARIESRHPKKRLWVATKQMGVDPDFQAAFSLTRAEKIAANFDPDALGYPVLSLRDEVYWIIDGHHRVRGAEIALGLDQRMECDVFEGLTKQDEGSLFLIYNTKRNPTPLTKFKVAVNSGWDTETAIAKIVANEGLAIAKVSDGGGEEGMIRITAIGAVREVYELAGARGLAKTLRILRDAFGMTTQAFTANMLRGLGTVVHHYGKELNESWVVECLRKHPVGVMGIHQDARKARYVMGTTATDSYAIAIVEQVNKRRGGAKLPRWWT